MQGYWQGVLGVLGPRSEVNAATGDYPISLTDFDEGGATTQMSLLAGLA